MYKEYLEFFGVTQENLQEIISIALSKGGDYADIYMEYSIINELMLRDGEVNTAGTHIDYGVGIRVVSNDKTGYAYSEITSMEEMKKAALTAAQIANENNSYIPPVKVNILKGNNFYPIEKSWDDVNISYKVPYLEHMNNIIFSLDKKVVKVIGKITDSSSKILIFLHL